ncbi:MAG: DUF1275 domain-containing protein [Bacteroidetes bacterium]|nr:DUF1275 domain-containing protein [Bacteroidota bacterium]
MTPKRSISYNTLLLVLTAGFCDAATFVSVDKLFSAHVTGNFIVFVYDIITRVDAATWVRLVTFPVFFFAIFFGGWVAGFSKARFTIVRIEGALLVIAGLVAVLMEVVRLRSEDVDFMNALIVVFAMGLQNTFGRLYSKEVHGTTTTMTGNVTQMALNLLAFVSGGRGKGLGTDALIVGGFLAGCFIGGVTAKWIGLTGIMIPGVMLLAWPWRERVE